MAAKKKTLVAAVIESTAGTLETDGADDALGIVEVSWSDEMEQITRSIMSQSLTPLDPLVGKSTASIEITLEMKGSGTIADAPEADALLQASWGGKKALIGGTVAASPAPSTTVFKVSGTGCNLAVGDLIVVEVGAGWQQRVITAVTPGTDEATVTVPALTAAPTAGNTVANGFKYSPVSSGHKTVSIYVYIDGGIKLSFRGCQGTFKISDFAVGTSPKMIFSMEALDVTYAASSTPGYTPNIDRTLKPAVVLGASLTLDNVEEKIRTFEFDLGIGITRRESIQAISGTDSMEISERNATGSIDPYVGTSISHITDWKAMTPAALLGVLKDKLAQPNLIAISVPRINRTSVSWKDADGVYAFGIPFGCGGLNGDDEAAMFFFKLPAL